MAVSIAKLAIHLTTDTSQMVAGFAAAKGQASSFSSTMAGIGKTIAGAALAAEIGLISTAIAAVVKEGVRFNAQMERMTVSIGGFLHNMEAAKSLLTDLREYDKVSPLGFEELAGGAQTLLGVGSQLEDIRGQMYMLGTLSATSGKNIQELAVIFGQVQNAGRLMTQDSKQFEAALIPVGRELQKIMGIDGMQLRKELEAGTVTLELFNQAMTNIAVERLDQVAAAADTISGKWSKVNAQFSQTSGALMEGIGPQLKDFLDLTNEALTGWEMIGKAMQGGKEELESLGEVFRVFRGDLGYGLLTEHGIFSEKHFTEEKAAADAMRKTQEDEIRQSNERVAALEQAKAKEREAAAEQKEQAKQLKKFQEDMAEGASKLIQKLRTPSEVFRDTMKELNEYMEMGLLDLENYVRAAEKARADLTKATTEKNKMDHRIAEASNPAALRGSQTAETIINRARDGIQQRQIEEQRKANALIQRGNDQREELIRQGKEKLTIKQVSL